jgi:hypothetical protein
MMISYVLEVFVMETIIASRGCVCVCVYVCVCLSLSRLQWLIAVAMYGRSSAVFLVVCILLVFLVFREVRLFVCEWVVQKRILRDNSES